MPLRTTAAVLVRHGGPEALEIRSDWVVPDPAPGEVLVEVRAAGVNNTDLWTRQGAYGTAADPDAEAGWLGPLAFPRVQGGDVCGVVVAVGQDGGDLLGRRVLVDPAAYRDDGPQASPVAYLGSESDGGFAGHVLVAADHAHDVSDSPLSDDELACLPVAYGTATRMLRRAGLQQGETVLVTGASGGVGIALVQLAAAYGAHVVAVTSSDKADAVQGAGAQQIVLRDAGDVAGQVRRAAPRGLHVVADVVGGPGLAALLPLLVDDGRWVIAGAIAGPVVELDLRRLYLHSLRMIGSSMHTREDFAALVELARTGAVRPLVADTYPLTRIHEAQERFAAADHVGKLVLHP